MATFKGITDRHKKIIETIKRDGYVSIAYLSEMFGISKITIKRDLDKISSQGYIKKIRGGAAVVSTETYEPPYLIRSLEMIEEKKIIATYAASILKPNQIISIDIGSTMFEFAKNILNNIELTIITNWIPIAQVLMSKRNLVNLFILGGKVRFNELAITGKLATDMLGDFNIDIAFISLSGISLEHGYTDYNDEDIEVKKQIIKRAKKVIILADHSKFGKVAHMNLGDIKMADQIITSEGVDKKYIEKIQQKGVKVNIVKNYYMAKNE